MKRLAARLQVVGVSQFETNVRGLWRAFN